MTGNTMVNALPCPWSLATVMLPPSMTAKALLIESPTPVPPNLPEIEASASMVQRHILQGTRLIARQTEIVYRLQSQGSATVEAEATLLSFEDMQWLHKEHLARLCPDA